MTPKDLKKLVKVCRDLGVTHYKGEGFEFSLGEAPVKLTAKKQPISQSNNDNYETDTHSYEEMLFWSAPVHDLVSDEDSV